MFTVGEIVLIAGTTVLILWLVGVQGIYVRALSAKPDADNQAAAKNRLQVGPRSPGPGEPPSRPS